MSILSKVYINDIYQGYSSGAGDKTWNFSQIYTSDYPLGGGYYLPMGYKTQFKWRVDTYDTVTELTTTGTDWYFTTKSQSTSSAVPDRDSVNFPDSTYNPDLNWTFEDGEYKWTTTQDIVGGGRWGQQIIVIGFNSVYYGSL